MYLKSYVSSVLIKLTVWKPVLNRCHQPVTSCDQLWPAVDSGHHFFEKMLHLKKIHFIMILESFKQKNFTCCDLVIGMEIFSLWRTFTYTYNTIQSNALFTFCTMISMDIQYYHFYFKVFLSRNLLTIFSVSQTFIWIVCIMLNTSQFMTCVLVVLTKEKRHNNLKSTSLDNTSWPVHAACQACFVWETFPTALAWNQWLNKIRR